MAELGITGKLWSGGSSGGVWYKELLTAEPGMGAAPQYPPSHPLSRFNQTWSSSLSSQGECSSHDHLSGPLLSSLGFIDVFPVLGVRNCVQYLGVA